MQEDETALYGSSTVQVTVNRSLQEGPKDPPDHSEFRLIDVSEDGREQRMEEGCRFSANPRRPLFGGFFTNVTECPETAVYRLSLVKHFWSIFEPVLEECITAENEKNARVGGSGVVFRAADEHDIREHSQSKTGKGMARVSAPDIREYFRTGGSRVFAAWFFEKPGRMNDDFRPSVLLTSPAPRPSPLPSPLPLLVP